MPRFTHGQLVEGLIFNENSVIRVGHKGCTSIVCSLENGQMAGVPWFDVYKGEKCISKWNGALLEGVELIPHEGKVSP